MPVPDALIGEAVARYFRERDRYVKLATVVEELLRGIVQRGNILASVTSRAKSESSLHGKLKLWQKKGNKDHLINTVEDALGLVGDLAAARLMVYFEADRAEVVRTLMRHFVGPQGRPLGDEPGDIEAKPDPRLGPGKSSPNYRATHCRVYLPESALGGGNGNLRGTACEVQVCSLLAHVWNEVEHDIVYKELGGAPGADERQCLEELAALTRQGDKVIQRLVIAAELRRAGQEKDFEDEADFIARMTALMPMPAQPCVDARELLHALLACGLRRPGEILDRLLTEGWQTRAWELIRSVNALAQERGLPWRLDVQDYLITLLAEQFGPKLIKDYPAAAQKAKPKRSIEVAKLVGEAMKSGQH